MATPRTLGQRVTRLENETESIYELIAEMRSTQLVHGEQLDEMRATLGGVQITVGELQGTVTELQGTVTELRGTMIEMHGTVAEVLRRLPDAS